MNLPDPIREFFDLTGARPVFWTALLLTLLFRSVV